MDSYSVVKEPRRRKNAYSSFLTCGAESERGEGTYVVEREEEFAPGLVSPSAIAGGDVGREMIAARLFQLP